jgi:hypothetical protein
MKSKTVNMQELVEELKVFTKSQIDHLRHATVLGIAKSIPMLVEASPVDTGLYAQSWSFTEEEFGAVLGNYAPHAAIIEYGARPFTPPIRPLLAWAKRVLQDPSQPETGYSDQVWALAKYTQEKIAREGIAPRHILEDRIPQIIDNIRQEYLKFG